MKKVLSIIFLIALFSFSSFAQEGKRYHAFSGTAMFGVDAGMSLGFTDYDDLKPELFGRLVGEYFFPTRSSGIFGLRGFYNAGYVGGKSDNPAIPTLKATIVSIGAGLTYNFSIQQAVFPYLFAGGSYSWVNPKDAGGRELPQPPAQRAFGIEGFDLNVEGGFRFLLSHAISLNISVGAQLSLEDNWDALPARGSNDMLMHGLVGLSYSFGADIDSDGDGVPDKKDQCPDTPPGVKVDAFGCPIDSDNDGVPDYLDKCPNTKAGMEVDENGCPVDSDGDGVPDRLDRCPNTPQGMKVNEEGCPDTDGDGVPDNRDKCPDTPQGAPVDSDGCPKDSDGDGVPDYKDECPNTPRGEQVDEKGCSTLKDTVVVKQVTLEGDTNFEFNKSNLLPSAFPVLNKLAKAMNDNPDSRWRIEGHTDAIGSDSYNMELSRRRAQSVVDYLIQQGIDRSRLEVVPLGESQPKATNDTQEGRAMNRRVEIKMIEGE